MEWENCDGLSDRTVIKETPHLGLKKQFIVFIPLADFSSFARFPFGCFDSCRFSGCALGNSTSTKSLRWILCVMSPFCERL